MGGATLVACAVALALAVSGCAPECGDADSIDLTGPCRLCRAGHWTPIECPWDGGYDAGQDAGRDAGTDFGTPCSEEAALECGLFPRQCCSGTWRAYEGSVCVAHPDDAGAPDCTATPEALGCPCGTEDARLCRTPLVPRQRCVAGHWTEDVGHACCP